MRILISNLSSYLPIYFSDCIHAVWSGPSLSANIIIDTTELQYRQYKEMPGWYFPQAKDNFVHTWRHVFAKRMPPPPLLMFFFFFFFFASKGSLFSELIYLHYSWCKVCGRRKTSPRTLIQCILYFLVIWEHWPHLDLFEDKILPNYGIVTVSSVAPYTTVQKQAR